MIRLNLIRFGVACLSLAILTTAASAGPPVHAAGRPGGVYPPRYPAPYNYGLRTFIDAGVPYGSGLYGPLGYGLGYSPFGYSGLNYGGIGYGALGYGYGYPGRYSSGYLGVPVIPGTYYPSPSPYQVVPTQPMVNPDPMPQPLPLPGSSSNTGEGTPGTITVITNDGATVTFDGIDTKETGMRHSFTTKPIPAGSQIRVQVKVDGPGGPSTISIGMRGGEKATVDMRK